MANMFPQRVLIVDDDPLQRAVLKQVFISHGSEMVETAEDGLAAISIVENLSKSFELIVMDLHMPKSNGVDLISYLAGVKSKARLLIISGLPADIVRQSNVLAEAQGLNSIGYLLKPFRLEELLEVIKKHLYPNFLQTKASMTSAR